MLRTLSLPTLLLWSACTGASPGDTDPDTDTDTDTDTDADTDTDTDTDTGAQDDDGDGSVNAADCDDADAEVHPGAEELCNGTDDDCDGSVDDEATDADTWYADADDDGFGGSVFEQACEAPAGFVGDGTDCDDANGEVHPGAAEVCNGTDDDCDGAVDDDAVDATAWHADADGDGYGDTTVVTSACDAPPATTSDASDCDDADPSIHPAATEICDAADVDEDCDSLSDDDDVSVVGSALYYDADGDGQGDPSSSTLECDPAGPWVGVATDCDDADAGDYVGAVEEAGNGDDEDCDGAEDCHADADEDGYRADPVATVVSTDLDCDDAGEALATEPGGDCDDGSSAVSPAGIEACDGVDDDCDGTADDGASLTSYADADGDGYGDPASVFATCPLPAGNVTNDTDCDDSTALANPAGTEVCANGLDDDCDDDPADCSFSGSYDVSYREYDLLFEGVTDNEFLGTAVATGDFDGDGEHDVANGMWGSTSTGGAALWYGPLASSGTWTATADAAWFGDSSQGGAKFGITLTVVDHDADGADDLVVGGYGEGMVWLLYGGATRRSGTSGAFSTEAEAASFTSSGAGSALGGGDVDGDGYEDIFVGAALASPSGTYSGSAHLLYGQGSARTSTSAADWTVEGLTAGDRLGAGTIVPDTDGDGLDEVIVGAPQEDTAATGAGAVYVFLGDTTRRTGTTPASTADATLYGIAASDYFGLAVHGLTDIDGDGYGDTGVHSDAPFPTWDSGTLDIYGGGATFPSTTSASISGDADGDTCGLDASSPGDLDGDGVNDLLVGAPGTEYLAEDGSGQAGLWYGPVSGAMTFSSADATFYGGVDNYFSRGLPDGAADVTGDGALDLVIGSGAYDSSSAAEAGAFYVFAGLGGQ